MKYWARIENSKAVEIIEDEIKPEFHPSITLIECNSETLEGDIYQNGVFSHPQKTINELKAEKIAEVNSIIQQKIMDGLVFENNTYQIRDSDRQNMNDVYTKLADGQSNPHGGAWRNMNNQMVPMNDTKVKQFIDAVFLYRLQLLQALWTHKDNINEITRSEDVIDYDVTTGYPQN